MGTTGVRRLIAGAIVAVTVAASAVVAVSAPASAVYSSSVLCQGYAQCAALGMSNHGYAAHTGTEYWRMIAGHNCTNYAAYVVRLAGGPSSRPWTGDGTARAWGVDNPKKTDRTPAVGAVAWWGANRNGAGASGHVAYVEAIIDASTIVISEDNYGGDFYWKVLHAGDASWPTGFIHFADVDTNVVPSWRAAPAGVRYTSDAAGYRTVDPTHVKPGATVWAQVSLRDTGRASWTGFALTAQRASDLAPAPPTTPTPPTTSTQTTPSAPAWLDATTAAMTTGTVAIGRVATVAVPLIMPATAVDGVDHSLSLTLETSGGHPIPHSTVALTLHTDSRSWFSAAPTPTISGTARQGQVLSASAGAWDPAAALTVRWYRDGSAIPGAQRSTYRLSADDVGHRITVRVDGRASGYIPQTRTSPATSLVLSVHPSSLAAGKRLVRGDQLVSANGRYALAVRATGAVSVLDRFHGNRTVWTTGRLHVASLVVQRRGGLIALDAHGRLVWRAKTTKPGATRLTMMGTGAAALLAGSSSVRWSTAKK